MACFFNKNNLAKFGALVVSVLFLMFLSQNNHLLFHFTVELVTSIVGCIMLVIIVNTMNFPKNSTYVFLGIACAFIGGMDLMHAIAFKGMNMINVSSMNTAEQLWIIARYVQSMSVLIALSIINKPVKYGRIVACYVLIFVYSIAVVFNSGLFPACYVDGVGFTSFKIISEYAVCAVLVVSTCLLHKNKNKYSFISNEYVFLMCSIVFAIMSETCLTLYTDIYGLSNILGHVFKFLSFYCIYVPLIRKNLQEPYNMMFNSLNESLEKVERVNKSLFSKNNELEEIKDKLERNLKLYKDFSEVLPISIVVREGDNVVYINKGTKDLLKLKSKRDMIGKTLFDFLEDGCKERVKERMVQESKNKIGPPMEEKLICADGSLVDVEVSAASLSIDNKEYFLGVFRDVTYMKKLKAVEMELKEKNEYEAVRNEFFANISHELRTPINVIYSALQLEELYFEKGEYDKIKMNNIIVKQNCMRLLRLINNLIDMTKIDAGFFKPVLKCSNMVDVVENIVLSVVAYVESRKMNITFDTEFEEEYVNCDSDLMERIMLNLISNSIKYGKPDGNIYVNISRESQGTVAISLKDDGIGIPKDKQDSVFERFIRIDKSLARNCEGSGIGLPLVKSLVEIQNGTIGLASEENSGTEIIMKFPIVEVEKEACAATDTSIETDNIIRKVSLEFSDIYDLWE